MLGALIPLAQSAFGLLHDHIEGKRKTKQAEDENSARLLSDTNKANSAWERAQIKQADKWSRRFVLALITAPIIVTVFDPVRGGQIWNNLKLVPLWYQGLFVSIILATWGLRQYTTWQQYKMQNGNS